MRVLTQCEKVDLLIAFRVSLRHAFTVKIFGYLDFHFQNIYQMPFGNSGFPRMVSALTICAVTCLFYWTFYFQLWMFLDGNVFLSMNPRWYLSCYPTVWLWYTVLSCLLKPSLVLFLVPWVTKDISVCVSGDVGKFCILLPQASPLNQSFTSLPHVYWFSSRTSN